MPHRDAPPSMSAARRTARLGAAMFWLGLVVSLGLTFACAFAWGISKTSLRSQRAAGVPDDQLASLIARTDFLADASLWVALGAVPLGLALIVVGLALRGRANRALRPGSTLRGPGSKAA